MRRRRTGALKIPSKGVTCQQGRSLGRHPVPSVSAVHARHVPRRVRIPPLGQNLPAPCHRRRRVLMAEVCSEMSNLTHIRVTGQSHDPSGSELLQTRLHTAYLTGTEEGLAVPPVRELERHARGSPLASMYCLPAYARTTSYRHGHLSSTPVRGQGRLRTRKCLYPCTS